MLKELPLKDQLNILEKLTLEQVKILIDGHTKYQKKLLVSYFQQETNISNLETLWEMAPLDPDIKKYAGSNKSFKEDFTLWYYISHRLNKDLKTDTKALESAYDEQEFTHEQLVEVLGLLVSAFYSKHHLRGRILKDRTFMTYVELLFGKESRPDVSKDDLFKVEKVEEENKKEEQKEQEEKKEVESQVKPSEKVNPPSDEVEEEIDEYENEEDDEEEDDDESDETEVTDENLEQITDEVF